MQTLRPAQDVSTKSKGGTSKVEDRSRKGGSDQKEPSSKDGTRHQDEHSGHLSRRSSPSPSPARSKRASSSSDSDDDHKRASVAESSSHTSKAEPPSKPTQKKRRSYRTKRCRSSGSSESSEDDQDKQSRSRSRSLSQGESPRLSVQNRARSPSKSHQDTQSKDLRRERSRSRDDRKFDRSRDRSRSPKRSSPIRSQRRGQSRSRQSRSPGRDKGIEEKASSAKASAADKSSASSVDTDSKEKKAKSAAEKSKQGKMIDKDSSSDGGKNKVVLYGPFEEEEASFDEEPSPERAESSTKHVQPEKCSGAPDKTSIHQPPTSSLDAVPLPTEPVAHSEDTQLEDMDISDSPFSGGVLEVEDNVNQNLPSGERQRSPSVTSRQQSETRATQECMPPQKVSTSEETLAKPVPAKAAIPWNYNEIQPPPPPPWLKPEVTKPVGQVRPFLREINPNESGPQKGLLQVKQEGGGAVGSLSTVPASSDTPLIASGKDTYKAEELSALASPASKVLQQSAFPDLSAKLMPQIPLTAVPPPPVNVHSGPLYSTTVMPVHVPFQFVGVPGHGQVGPGATLPVAQEKSSHVAEQQHEQCPPDTPQSSDNQALDLVDSAGGTASQVSGPLGNESSPLSPAEESKDASAAPDVSVAEEAKHSNQSGSSSRSSSPAEGRSRSSSKERSNSHASRSQSGDRETMKRSRSSESESPRSDTKRLCKDDRADSEEKRKKTESRDRHDRHDSTSPDRSARDSRAKRKSVSPERKQSKSHDRKRSKSRERRQSRSRDRRSRSKDRRRSQSRDKKRSPIRERRRSKSRERRPSKSRERRRSKSRDRKRSKSKDRKRSKSRERKRSKSRERKRSKSRDRKRSKSREKRRSQSRSRKRSKSPARRSSVGRGGIRSSWRRSTSRSRRSLSRDRTKGRSQSREKVRSRRSQSRGKDSTRRKSKDRGAPKGALILKRYKNELSSESDSSPERKSKAKPSSPVKKRQRMESDAESVSSQDDKPEDNMVASPMISEASMPDADARDDDPIDSDREREIEKKVSSETVSKDERKGSPYGPLLPNEPITSAAKEAQPSDDEMEDEQDMRVGSDVNSSLKTKADGKALHTSAVSSSSSKESVCSVGGTLVASSKGHSASHGASRDRTAHRSPEPKQDRQERSTSKRDNISSEKFTVPLGESAVSSSTGSPGQTEEQLKSGAHPKDLPTENISKENSSSVQRPSACTDSHDEHEKRPSTTTGNKAGDATGDDEDARSESDNGRDSRSRSPSSTSSVERVQTRKESSSSSGSPSPESRERRRSRDKKSPSRSRDRRRSRERRPRSRSRPRRSWSRAMELQRKRSAERLRKKSRSPRKRSVSKRRSPPPRKKSRSRSRRRSRTHSPPERKRKSRSREREPSVVKVDKAQLLEAARKNMQAMLQRGVVAKGLPVAAAAAVNATVKVVAAAVAAAAADPRSSLAAKLDVASSATSTPPNEPPVLPLALSGDGTGPAVTLGITEEPPKIKKSLAALTEICKAISDEEKREYAGEVEPKTAEEVAEEFQQSHHHPFKLKEPPPPIRFNIPNATNLPVKTLAEKVADAAHLHKQFPVSSGNQHRVKELEWVPVEKTEPVPAPKAARAAATKKSATPPEEGATSLLALMPPPAPLPKHETFSPLPTVATPPVFQVEEAPMPISSAVISSTVTEPPVPVGPSQLLTCPV
ncbi:hypothetical protein HPB50_022491 [Hyalomma asiaticum]|uniref:Uncharacterized protein n=1 Tax=Hyalomma asiaticum TaxID=266040 RepID=A0ACB7S782_HYAAI|nr:hypothetical protein HPB50_022491 [Hyalomma asiaticum]